MNDDPTVQQDGATQVLDKPSGGNGSGSAAVAQPTRPRFTAEELRREHAGMSDEEYAWHSMRWHGTGG